MIKQLKAITIAAIVVLFGTQAHATMKTTVVNKATILSKMVIQNTITADDVRAAQQQWANDLIAIGKAYKNPTAYKKAANHLVDTLYAYNSGGVLFKPTKAKHEPFRQTKASALSYFIGHDKRFPEDKGFALTPWVDVKFNNAGMYFYGDMAMVMGEYVFTAKDGSTATVEYTFGYIKDNNGQLRIVLHHSSLPYAG